MELVLHQSTRLALAAFDALARTPRRLSRAELADRVGTTVHFLPQVLRPLIEAGWVESRRGPSGGYELSETARDVSLLQVVEAMEGPLGGRCLLRGGPCPSNDNCMFHTAWMTMQAELIGRLDDHPALRSRGVS
jgi:Rrf2 family protein